MSFGIQVKDRLASAAVEALRRSTDYLVGLQNEEGYWWGELTADTTLESDYILLQLWLHPPQGSSWSPPNRDQVDRAVRSILDVKGRIFGAVLNDLDLTDQRYGQYYQYYRYGYYGEGEGKPSVQES